MTKNWMPALAESIDKTKQASHQLAPPRQELLDDAAAKIAKLLQESASFGLNFICTHNSRRSHLAQLWAAVAATAYGVTELDSFSGGTEATACNERIVRSFRRAGFSVVTQSPTADNPVYFAQFEESTPPLKLFSKRYDDSENPASDFLPMMCCSDADDKCPVVVGASGRVSLHYNDPKESDGTDQEAATYDARRDEIGAEMFYLVRQIKSHL